MPNIVVVGYRAIVEPNCQSPKPAMTVKVTIRNSGGPLPAKKGTIFAKEFGGGGHTKASGLSVVGSLAEVQAAVLSAARRYLGGNGRGDRGHIADSGARN